MNTSVFFTGAGTPPNANVQATSGVISDLDDRRAHSSVSPDGRNTAAFTALPSDNCPR